MTIKLVLLFLAVLLSACGTGAPAATPATKSDGAPATEARTLVMFARVEPATLAIRSFIRKGAGLYATWRLFNALPALIDARGEPQPELLASLPTLNTDTWRVFPDGTMQTTYTLRPNLTWHDGQPFTANDMVFAWRVYSDPDLGLSREPPMAAIAEVIATDREHFTIRWKTLYPDADDLSPKDHELAPLPQHILGPAFDQMATAGKDAFINHPFWSPQYVGLGPYRLQHREPGSALDLVRFEGYALGVPKIGRIQLRFSDDQNVVVAHLLAGEAHLATDSSLGETAAVTLAKEWAQTGGGSVSVQLSSWRYLGFQLRPEVANPPAVLDLRVRKAIVHLVDRESTSEAAYAGQAVVSDTPIWTKSAWGAAIDSSIPTYPFDPRASERLLTEAGFSRGADGNYRSAGGRLSLEIATTESPSSNAEIVITANQLQVGGLEIQQRVIPRTQAQDAELRAKFPAMQLISTLMAEPGLQTLASSQIPSEANRWIGGNRGGWSSQEFDRLLDMFHHTLARPERLMILRQMLRIYNEELPRHSLYFPAGSIAHVAALKGVTEVAPEAVESWNVHEWEFR